MDRFKKLTEVCKTTGVTRRAIQGYEKAGLVAATEKNKYGHLLYDNEAIERIKRIRLYQCLGFKVQEIKRIIDAPPDILRKELQQKVLLLETDVKVIERVISQTRRIIEELS